MCFAWADSSVPVYNVSQKFCTASRRMKFATKPIRHYPPHLRYIATLPWEIKKNKFSADIQQIWKKMHFVASRFVILKGRKYNTIYI